MSEVARDGETDALRGPNDGGVHPDHFASGIYERAARVSRIECRIGLNDIVDQTAAGAAQRTTEATDDPRRDGLLKTHWTANRDGDLSGANGFGVGERQVHDLVGGDAKYCKIGVRIFPDQIGVETPAIGERNREATRPVNDVTVGQ